MRNYCISSKMVFTLHVRRVNVVLQKIPTGIVECQKGSPLGLPDSLSLDLSISFYI